MWWHWGEGLVPLLLLQVPAGQLWLAALAGQALALPADGAFDINGP